MKAFMLATCLLIMVVYAADAQVSTIASALPTCLSSLQPCVGLNLNNVLACPKIWNCLFEATNVKDANSELTEQGFSQFCSILTTETETNEEKCNTLGNMCFGSNEQNPTECLIGQGLPNYILTAPNLTNLENIAELLEQLTANGLIPNDFISNLSLGGIVPTGIVSNLPLGDIVPTGIA
ncbi:uncharacterized protein LOC105830204 [Monomorium pharaonis]|uniref:uncharacterized protein LOC105830204 n=1 Tax=Monomorium pharaonis TaxID=307658 RepID=UPI00063F0CA4|nr:uncharacterized protein LOC105830204 [Monomorium pharaonis]XP_036148705.1 uncharacterized protein LOC105830204 [Monomorium pharaonis]